MKFYCLQNKESNKLRQAYLYWRTQQRDRYSMKGESFSIGHQILFGDSLSFVLVKASSLKS